MPPSEALQPIFGGLGFDVAETVGKRRGSTFQLSKDPFDGIPISAAKCLKSEACSLKCSLEVFRAGDEKHGGFDIKLLSKFAQKDFGESRGSRRKEQDRKQFVRLRIGGGVQPELLVVDPNHRFVGHNLIRRFPRFGL